MFTPRHVKHSRLLLRHARKYLRYKNDRLSGPDREEIVAGIENLRDALHRRDHERVHSAADALDKTLHRLTPVTWASHWREKCAGILGAIVEGVRAPLSLFFAVPNYPGGDQATFKQMQELSPIPTSAPQSSPKRLAL